MTAHPRISMSKLLKCLGQMVLWQKVCSSHSVGNKASDSLRQAQQCCSEFYCCCLSLVAAWHDSQDWISHGQVISLLLSNKTWHGDSCRHTQKGRILYKVMGGVILRILHMTDTHLLTGKTFANNNSFHISKLPWGTALLRTIVLVILKD